MLCMFGKTVKKRLVDLDRTQGWLIEQVREKTGLYLDASYLRKILSGERKAPKIRSAIGQVLEITNEP